MKAHILILLFLCQNINGESLKAIKADSLLQRKLISLKAIGLGGYSKECIEMELQNFTNQTLLIEIESGRRFVSLDSGEQDILVVKPSLVTVQPRSKIFAKLFGFCCQSNKSAPKANSTFYKSYMAPKHWQQLTNYLDTNSQITPSTMQSAIWALSNKKRVEYIGSNNAEDRALRQMVAMLLKQAMPWYNVVYDESKVIPGDTNQIAIPLMFHADIDLTVPHARSITATIVDKDKKTIKVLTQYYYIRDGVQSFSITQNLKNYKKGKYFLVITGEKGYKIEKEFEI